MGVAGHLVSAHTSRDAQAHLYHRVRGMTLQLGSCVDLTCLQTLFWQSLAVQLRSVRLEVVSWTALNID